MIIQKPPIKNAIYVLANDKNVESLVLIKSYHKTKVQISKCMNVQTIMLH